MDTLSLLFSLLVALLFGVLLGWWFGRSGKKHLQERTIQLDADLQTANKQLAAARSELQLQHDDYDAKLKTMQVDLDKRSAGVNAEQAKLAVSLSDTEARAQKLQADLDASVAALAAERERSTAAVNDATAKVAAVQAELDECRAAAAAQKGPNGQAQVAESDAYEGATRVMVVDIPGGITDESPAPLTPGAAPVVRVDDLTRIKGVGPRFAAALASAGYTSYRAIAQANPDDLRTVVGVKSWQAIDTSQWVSDAKRLEDEPLPVHTGDDLISIEGIGPRYDALLRSAGVTTFAQLAKADDAALADILKPKAWQRPNYEEWREQARLAAAGKWDELKALQAELNKRKEGDLVLIQGIGDTSAAALRAAGIDTYAALAAATPEQVDSILSNAGLRSGNAAAWIAEAQVRAKGKRVKRQRPERVQNVKVVEVSCPQDLAQIEGIGTVYEEKLYNAGVGSFWEVAGLPDAELVQILGLKRFQDVDLAAIKRDAMRIANETNTAGRVWDGTPPDDFEILEGIGQVYERRLYAAGICSYKALAAATPEQLAEICQAPAFRRPNYADWIAQAKQRVA